MSRYITERTIVRETPTGVTERITIRGDSAAVNDKIAALQNDSMKVKEVPSGIQRSALPSDYKDPAFVDETVANLRSDPDFVTERVTIFSGNPDAVGRRVNELANRSYFDPETLNIIKGETSTKQSVERSAKGNVAIEEICPQGKFIVLENTNRTDDQNIGDWKIKRRVDGKREIVFTFPSDFILRAGNSVKIWSRDSHGRNNPPYELVFHDEDSFGIGNNAYTYLFDRDGGERAKHVQRAV
uniref:LTD domain-containing protein n=1 Tax=Acrobeloides nanus TaxID=290746 RepID=A0A914CT48_9BILA